MWIDVANKTPSSDATVTIFVCKGPMEGIHHECSLFEGDWYNDEDLVAPHSWVSHWRATPKAVMPSDKIAGRTLSQWADLARRDDCFDQMVPSDLRGILQFIA